MAKFTFTSMYEWSDRSPHSPSITGQIPCAAILPDDERVGLEQDDIEIAYWNNPPGRKDAYTQIHANVRVRESHWGDNPMRSYGRSGAKLEVLAPKGSKFLFARYCPAPWCGEQTGEQELPDKKSWEKAAPLYHKSCKAQVEAEEKAIAEAVAEMRREEQEWIRQMEEQDASME